MFQRLSFYFFLVILVGLGLFFLLKQDLILGYWAKWLGEEDSRIVVASVQEIKGQPKYRLPRKLVYRNLNTQDQLRYFDTISTDENSSITLAFNSGLVLELRPNSILVLEEPRDGQKGEVVISFLQGDFNIIQKGQSGKVTLTKGDEAIDPAGRKSEELLIEKQEILLEDIEEEITEASPTPPPATPTPIPQIAKPTPKPVEERKESLPDSYIASMIRKQKPFLNRCYAQHLRLNPNASGRMNLSFTISPEGNVTSTKVLKSSLSDPRLQKCTLSVIERIKFRSYKGDPIVVNYPINYE